MMTDIRHYILVGNKRYHYTMAPARSYTTIVCDGAGISVRVPNEQVPVVLGELARHIISAREQGDAQSEVLRFRVSPAEKQRIERSAMESGYANVSAYLRAVALEGSQLEDEL